MPFEGFCHGKWEKITTFWLSRHFNLQNDKKRWKLVKNWNFLVQKNPMELQKFGAIWKLLPWGVRENYKILAVAQFSPSKWQKTTKNGIKLKFSDRLKCNTAQKFWCHLIAFTMVSKKKLKKFGCHAIFTFKCRKTMKIHQKLRFFLRQIATELQKFGAIWKLGSWWVRKKSYISFVTSFSPSKMTKNGLHYRGPDNSKVTACWWLWTSILVRNKVNKLDNALI